MSVRFEVEPNPYDSSVDYFRTRKSEEARDALLAAAEAAWDQCGDGEEKVIKIRIRNRETPKISNNNDRDLYAVPVGVMESQNRLFRNVLKFKTVEQATESIVQIKRLYAYFERIGDRAGQHHAEVLALTGRNRARWSGKKEESAIFEQWLFNH